MTSMFGFLHIPLAPLRLLPSDQSEMTSQVLFGELFTILQKEGNWVQIQLVQDAYIGWMDVKGFKEISESVFNQLKLSYKALTSDIFSEISSENGTFWVPMGSVLPFFLESQFEMDFNTFSYKGSVAPFDPTEKILIQKAKSFLKAPYLWGGKTIFGVDCSGFTQIVMGQFGLQLPRDAYQQANVGELVSFVSEAKTGDLAFFENADGKIIHVGLILPDSQIIHAHGEVRIDSLDDMGIFNKKTGKHSHRLRFIKRYFNVFQ